MDDPVIDPALVFAARRLALKLALAYVVLCSAYILLSSHIVSRWAGDVSQLAFFEQAKGLAFVFLTGFLFYAFAYRVLHRIELQEREISLKQIAMVRAERRSLAATLASSIAHDIKNMLTILSGGTALLADASRPNREDREELGVHMQKAVEDMNALARRLMILGHESFGTEVEELDMLEAMRRAVDFARTHQRVRACDIRISGAPGIRLALVPRRIGTLTLNLLINAAEAITTSRGRIDIVVKRAQSGGAEIEFHDNGPGLSSEIAAHVFTPFVTSKEEGTGLGLLSVKLAVEEHGGTVAYERSTRLGGACFRVTINNRKSE
jgi:two-component system sensor histidine kinase HydH